MLFYNSKKGVSLVALVITIIVIVILGVLSFIFSTQTINNANFAAFSNELKNIENVARTKQLQLQKEKRDDYSFSALGLKKVTLEKVPWNFKSADDGILTGYIADLDILDLKDIKRGRGKIPASNTVVFGDEDLFILDSSGKAYYSYTFKTENGDGYYNVNTIQSKGITGPIISNETFTLINDNANAIISCKVTSELGGNVNVYIGGNEAKKTGNDTYQIIVDRNRTYYIRATEQDGLQSIKKITVTGIIEKEPPTPPPTPTPIPTPIPTPSPTPIPIVKPSITVQPQNTMVPLGTNIDLSVTVINGYPLPTTYQWQLSTDNGATWNDILGATESTYSSTMTMDMDGYQYRVLVGNSSFTGEDRVVSRVATVNVAYYQNTSNSKYYITLAEALNAVQSNETIAVLEDVNDESIADPTLVSGKIGVKLDLVGKTVLLKKSLINNGELDIYSSEGNAILQGEADSIVKNNGFLTMNKVHKSNTISIISNNSSAKNTYTISNFSNSNLTLYENSIVEYSNCYAGTLIKSTIYNSGTINCDGGSIICKLANVGECIQNSGSVTISYGQIISNSDAISNMSTLNINGGTIISDGRAISNSMSAGIPITKISSGHITSNKETAIYSSKTLEISGGDIKGYSYGVYCFGDGITNITGGKINSSNSSGIYVTGNHRVNIGTKESGTQIVNTELPSIIGTYSRK